MALRVQLVGDISFNGLLCDPLHQVTLAADLRALHASIPTPDVRIGNWESPIADGGEINSEKFTVLATTQRAASQIGHFPIDVAVLGNNHVGDLHLQGFRATQEFLDRAGVETVGAGLDGAAEPLILERGGISLAVASFVGEETNPRIAANADLHINMIGDGVTALATVRELSAAHQLVIVSLHWGIEYTDLPTPRQRKLARALVDAGADIVMGHHPHCPQPVETHEGGVIIYSLGNFVFSGLFGRETKGWPQVSQAGGMYDITVQPGAKPVVEYIPLTLKNDGVSLRQERRVSRLRRRLLRKAVGSSESRYRILHRFALLYAWFVRVPAYFVYVNGGVLRTIGKIRPKHLRGLAESVSLK